MSKINNKHIKYIHKIRRHWCTASITRFARSNKRIHAETQIIFDISLVTIRNMEK